MYLIHSSFLVLFLTLALPTIRAYEGTISLDLGNYMVNWKVAENNNSITFIVDAKNAEGWIGLGFTQNNTDMGQSDLVIGQVNQLDETKLDIGDFWSETEGQPKEDAERNLLKAHGYRNPEERTAHMEFTRLLDTGDSDQDNVISLEGIYVMWAKSKSERLSITGHGGGGGRGYAPRKILFNQNTKSKGPSSSTGNLNAQIALTLSIIFAFVICK